MSIQQPARVDDAMHADDIDTIINACNDLENLSYEDSIAKLEQACQLLNDESIALETSLKLYEAGNLFANHCKNKLDAFNQHISQVEESGNGTTGS